MTRWLYTESFGESVCRRAPFLTASRKVNHRFGRYGAGEGNRTLVISLGSWSNAIIRHPLWAADFVPDVGADLKFFFICNESIRPASAQARAVVRGQAPAHRRGACSRGLAFRLPVHGNPARSCSVAGSRGGWAGGSPIGRCGCRGRRPCVPCPGSVRLPAPC